MVIFFATKDSRLSFFWCLFTTCTHSHTHTQEQAHEGRARILPRGRLHDASQGQAGEDTYFSCNLAHASVFEPATIEQALCAFGGRLRDILHGHVYVTTPKI